LLFAACRWVVARTHLALPPGLMGLLVLLALLLSRLVSESQVGAGADALLRILGALFVPVSIGAVRHLGLLWTHGSALVLVLLVSLVLGQLAAGLAARLVDHPRVRK